MEPAPTPSSSLDPDPDLLEVNHPEITHAHLSFVEHEHEWIGGEGRRAEVPRCVTWPGSATNDWGRPPQPFIGPDLMFRDRLLAVRFIPQTTTAGQPGAIQRWRAFDVTDHVRQQMQRPDGPILVETDGEGAEKAATISIDYSFAEPSGFC